MLTDKDSQQKKEWEQSRKRIYPAVYHFQVNQFIPLTDKIMPELQIPENPDVALCSSDRPYLKENHLDIMPFEKAGHWLMIDKAAEF